MPNSINDSAFAEGGVKSAKLSEVIQEKLERMILEGILVPGEKLPPERELAKQFEVSRPSLREALQILEAKNLVHRKQGGGTFVSDKLLGSLADPLFDLIAKNNESQFDLLEFRLGLEGMSAYYAAMRGTPADFEKIREKYEAIADAQIENDIRLEAEAVYEFYIAICEASHNMVLLHLGRSMAPLLIDNIDQNLTILARKPGVDTKVINYREKLFQSILSGYSEKAWAASHQHLAYIEEVLLSLTEENSRMERSLRRMQRG